MRRYLGEVLGAERSELVLHDPSDRVVLRVPGGERRDQRARAGPRESPGSRHAGSPGLRCGRSRLISKSRRFLGRVVHVERGRAHAGAGRDVAGGRRLEAALGERVDGAGEQPRGRRRGWTCSQTRGLVTADTLTPCPRRVKLSKRLVIVSTFWGGPRWTASSSTRTTTHSGPVRKEYCDRSLVPRMEQFLEEKTIDARPPGWRPASRACSASTCRRSTAARASATTASTRCSPRRSSKVSASLLVLLRHPLRLRRAVPGGPGHRGAEAALAAEVLLRRADRRDRDDRAVRRLRPRRAEDDRGARRRRLGAERVEDLHHQRLHAPTWSSSPPAPTRARAPRASRCSSSRRAWRASPAAASSTRSARPSPIRRAVLRGRPRAGRQRDRRGRPRLHPHDGAAGRRSGSARRCRTSRTPRRSSTRRSST